MAFPGLSYLSVRAANGRLCNLREEAAHLKRLYVRRRF